MDSIRSWWALAITCERIIGFRSGLILRSFGLLAGPARGPGSQLLNSQRDCVMAQPAFGASVISTVFRWYAEHLLQLIEKQRAGISVRDLFSDGDPTMPPVIGRNFRQGLCVNKLHAVDGRRSRAANTEHNAQRSNSGLPAPSPSCSSWRRCDRRLGEHRCGAWRRCGTGQCWSALTLGPRAATTAKERRSVSRKLVQKCRHGSILQE